MNTLSVEVSDANGLSFEQPFWRTPVKSVPLTAADVPAIKAAIKAGATVTLELEGELAARAQPIIKITRKQAAQILKELAEADEGNDWAEYGSWK